MKRPKKPIESTAVSVPASTSIVAPTDQIGIVSITHFQSVKQSIDYQSADCGYSLKINCPDDPKQIRNSIRRAERTIEKFLVEKITQQTTLLKSLGARNR